MSVYHILMISLSSSEKPGSDLSSLLQNLRGDSDLRCSVQALIRYIGRSLLELRTSPLFSHASWDWIGDKKSRLTKRDANSFLFSAVLDYRAGPVDVWDNARFFIEEVFSNPEHLWEQIHDYSLEEWSAEFVAFDLHRDIRVHNRLHQVAGLMIRYYLGDARRIWEGFEDMPEEIFRRIKILGVPDTTASLLIGALKDVGIATGRCDIWADTPVRRVLARMFCGQFRPLSPYQATQLSRMIAPADPWILDRPLYILGIRSCGPLPRCSACPVRESCVYLCGGYGITRPDPVIHQSLFGETTVQKTLKFWQEESG